MFKYLFLLSLLVAVGCFQVPTLDELILRPNPTIEQTPEDAGYAYEEAILPLPDNRSIVAWYIPSEESKALVCIIPGSDANKSLYLEGLPVFLPYGYDVVLFDYEGYGSSPGTPSLYHALDDAFAAVNYAKTKHEKVFIYSVSLGTPLAARVASEIPVEGVIFEGSFIIQQEAELWLRNNDMGVPLFWDVANAYIYPQAPEGFDILKYIQQNYEPKLFMHSIEDTVTPYEGGVRVFEAAPEPKEFWQMIGDHGKMIRIDPDQYIAKVTGWLNSHVK